MRHPLFAIILATLLLVGTLVFLTGCRAAECRDMAACCDAVVDMEGLGGACAGLASDTRDPTTCRAIKRNIRYMLEDRAQEIPAACQ